VQSDRNMAESNGTNSERLVAIIAALRPLQTIVELLQRIDSKRQQPRRLMRLKEAANYLCMSPWQVRRLIATGELSRIGANENMHAPFLLDKFELDSWIERNKM
jgi:hypothetical protein